MSMNYTKETKIKDIPNAKIIAANTKKTIDYMVENWTISDFVKWNEKKHKNEIKTESLSTLCGTSSGAIANRIDEQDAPDIYGKIGAFLGSWIKGGNKNNAVEIAKKAEENAKLSMAKNMLLAKLAVEQIAKITGLSVNEINALKTETNN